MLFVKPIVNIEDHVTAYLSAKAGIQQNFSALILSEKGHRALQLGLCIEFNIKTSTGRISLIGNVFIIEMISALLKAVFFARTGLVFLLRSIADKVQFSNDQ